MVPKNCKEWTSVTRLAAQGNPAIRGEYSCAIAESTCKTIPDQVAVATDCAWRRGHLRGRRFDYRSMLFLRSKVTMEPGSVPNGR